MKNIEFLRCPICKAELEFDQSSFKCCGTAEKRHCFDIAASGYADLSYRNGGGGDPKDAVTDRTLFLDRGYYQPLAEEIIRLSRKHKPISPVIIDAGCGEGYYSDMIASSVKGAYLLGFDLSKHAVKKASARRNVRGGDDCFYAVASVFDLPVVDSCADILVSMFAPIAEAEAMRVLKNDGVIIIGAAASGHLYELKEAIYDEVRLNEERVDLPSNMAFAEKTNVRYLIDINDKEDIKRLFGMTPYRFRTSEASYNRLLALEKLSVSVDVDFYVYKNICP